MFTKFKYVVCSLKDTSKTAGGQIKLKRLNTVDEGTENVAFTPDAPNGNTAGERPRLKTLLSSVSTAPLSSRFQEVQYGTIDVWWLFDDGGRSKFKPSLGMGGGGGGLYSLRML